MPWVGAQGVGQLMGADADEMDTANLAVSAREVLNRSFPDPAGSDQQLH
jgi:hypothetical protein